MPSETCQKALATMQSIRRKLTERLAERIVEQTQSLQRGAATNDDPLGSCSALEGLCYGLTRVNNVIASLRAVALQMQESPPGPGHAGAVTGTFDSLCALVSHERFEDASRLLAQLLRMPVDRAFTATRFFGRALAADPTIQTRLADMCEQIEDMPLQRAMAVLVAAFGLQAVESGAAIHALRERRRALAGNPSARLAMHR
jgi:hypothetical protein